MIVCKLNISRSFTVVLDGNFLMVLFTDLQEAHIDEGFKKDLAFHFIDSYG
jgi:hypothetical protein